LVIGFEDLQSSRGFPFFGDRPSRTRIALPSVAFERLRTFLRKRCLSSEHVYFQTCANRGQVFLAKGNLGEAGQELSIALETAQHVGNPTQLWLTHAVLIDLLQAHGQPDEAGWAYGNPLSVIEKLASGLKDKSLRDTYMISRLVQEIGHKAQGYRLQEKDFGLRYRWEHSTTYWPVRLTRIPPSSLAKTFFLKPIERDKMLEKW
jgi:hypothetical protein